MDAGLFGFILGIVIIILLVLALIVLIALRIRARVIPEEERWVIFRLGRFNRIAGPGVTPIIESIEEVRRKIRVRDEPANYTVEGLFIFDIPFGFTLNFWRRFDLPGAAGTDRQKLANLALFEDNERTQQILVIIREALIKSIAWITHGRTPPPEKGILGRLLFIVPGLEDFEKLREKLKEELTANLPAIGVTPNFSYPITVTRIHLSQKLIELFEDNRAVETLRLHFPHLSEEVMVQVISSLKGAAPLSISSLNVQGLEAQFLHPEFRIDDESQVKPRLMVGPPREIPVIIAKGAIEDASTRAAPVDDRLNKDDLKVLKRVPRLSASPSPEK
jgi:hypothetical protein